MKRQLNFNEMEGDSRGESVKRWQEARLSEGKWKVEACLGDREADQEVPGEVRRGEVKAGWRGRLSSILSMGGFSPLSLASPTLGLEEGDVCEAPTRLLPQAQC